MKKILYYLTISTLLLGSCKKEQKKNTSALQKVSFTVAGFSQSTAAFNAAPSTSARALNALGPDSLGNYIANLTCLIYDASGKNIATITQTTSQTGFGTITEYLNAGSYTAAFIGGQHGINIKADNLSTAVITYPPPLQVPVIPFGDTFFQKVALTVGSAATSQSITLNRIDAELEVNIRDQIPTGASYIELTVNPEAFAYSIGNQMPVFGTVINDDTGNGPDSTLIVDKQLTSANIGTTNYNFTIIILNTTLPFTATLSCNNENHAVIASQIIPNVTCQVNKKTILTGNLFGGSGTNATGGFQVSVDSTWNPVKINVPFAVQKKARLQ